MKADSNRTGKRNETVDVSMTLKLIAENLVHRDEYEY
jgi:hypothetical protein